MHDKAELLAAYDGTGPYCMTLQEFIDFDQYVRCFTFGKTDIMPVAYDPRERRYLVDHAYLSSDLGARIVRDAQTLNTALGYEMNTIEFAVRDGVPYAIDFLNPAPDFERDRITPHYFEMVVDRMARARDRSGAPWARPADVAAVGRHGRPGGGTRGSLQAWTRVDGSDFLVERGRPRPGGRGRVRRAGGPDARTAPDLRRTPALPVPAAVLPVARR